MLQNYTDCLCNNKIILKSQQRVTQKKSIRLHYVVMMIRDCKHLIGSQHIRTEKMLLKYAKVR